MSIIVYNGHWKYMEKFSSSESFSILKSSKLYVTFNLPRVLWC